MSVRHALLALCLIGCVPAAFPEGRPPSSPTPPAGSGEREILVPQAPWRTSQSEAGGHESPIEGATVLLRGARLLLGDGREIARGHVLLQAGKIAAVGEGDGVAPDGARVVDASGKVVTPGLIDTHSHLGVYPMPATRAHSDGNEMTGPLQPGVRAIDAFWPQDPGIERALAGGVTTIQALPGSGNLIGGRAVTLKLRHAPTARAMHFAGAPDGLKMACGENPKRVYGERTQTPMTRMGNLERQRDAFQRARRLIAEWDAWRDAERRRIEKNQRADAEIARKRKDRADKSRGCSSGETPKRQCQTWEQEWQAQPIEDALPELPALPPKRDYHLETLAGAIEGHVIVHVHCYRADDMESMMALASEAGFQIRSFHHALEAYKIRGELVRQGIAVSTWADWWGFKMEAYDGIPENLALVHQAGGRAIVHSDSEEGIRRLNQEAAKGMYTGRARGMTIDDAEAIRWVTQNPAWALGVEQRAGTLEVGKDGDVVVWSHSPFSVYSRAELVFVDGTLRHQATDRQTRWSDLEAQP